MKKIHLTKNKCNKAGIAKLTELNTINIPTDKRHISNNRAEFI